MGGGLHKSRCCLLPSHVIPFLFLIPASSTSLPCPLSRTTIPSPSRDLDATHAPHALSCPLAAAHDPEEPGVSTQPPAKGAASPILGQPCPHDRWGPPSTPCGHRGFSLNGWGSPLGHSASAHCTVTDVLSCHSLTHRFSELSLAHLYLVTGSVFIHWAAPLGQASLC